MYFNCQIGKNRILNDRKWRILLNKSKIERRQKSRKCRFLDNSAAGMLHSASTKVHGRFSEKRRGPSHRCAPNASAALENFVRDTQKTFSTVSEQSGPSPSIKMDRRSAANDHYRNSVKSGLRRFDGLFAGHGHRRISHRPSVTVCGVIG